jgi:hypothetical protein
MKGVNITRHKARKGVYITQKISTKFVSWGYGGLAPTIPNQASHILFVLIIN